MPISPSENRIFIAVSILNYVEGCMSGTLQQVQCAEFIYRLFTGASQKSYAIIGGVQPHQKQIES